MRKRLTVGWRLGATARTPPRRGELVKGESPVRSEERIRDTKAFIPTHLRVAVTRNRSLRHVDQQRSTVVAPIRRLTRSSDDAHPPGEIQERKPIRRANQNRASFKEPRDAKLNRCGVIAHKDHARKGACSDSQAGAAQTSRKACRTPLKTRPPSLPRAHKRASAPPKPAIQHSLDGQP